MNINDIKTLRFTLVSGPHIVGCTEFITVDMPDKPVVPSSLAGNFSVDWLKHLQRRKDHWTPVGKVATNCSKRLQQVRGMVPSPRMTVRSLRHKSMGLNQLNWSRDTGSRTCGSGDNCRELRLVRALSYTFGSSHFLWRTKRTTLLAVKSLSFDSVRE